MKKKNSTEDQYTKLVKEKNMGLTSLPKLKSEDLFREKRDRSKEIIERYGLPENVKNRIKE